LRFSTLLLILSIVFAIASVPSTASQTFTTVTDVLTTTGLLTQTVYSTNTIGTTTQTIVSSNTFISTTDTIGNSGTHICTFDYWNITIDPGTIDVTGTIGPPSSKIDFYIMNQKQFSDFNHSECGNTPYVAELAVYDLTSTYSLDWKNPPTGWYYFIFSTETSGNSAITTPFVLVATFNQEQTSTVYNVVTNQATPTATQTVTSIQVTQMPTGLGLSINPELIGGIIAVVFAVVALLYVVRSRTTRKPRRVKGKDDEGNVCINCGKPLPAGSKFCNKCGTAQE